MNFDFRKMDVGMVRKILNRASTNINAVNSLGRSALHIAAMKDTRACVDILIYHQKKGILKYVVSKFKTEADSADLCLEDINGDSPLTLAIKHNSTEATDLILTKLINTSQIERVEWSKIWQNCQSTKMQQILLKHFQAISDTTEDSISSLCTNIANDKIILKLPNTFNSLFSLLIDKIFSTFPSPIVVLAKVLRNKSKLSFKQMKIKENSNYDLKSIPRLDNGIDVNIKTLIDDINYQMNLKKFGNNHCTYDVNIAHEYVRDIIRRKLPIL